MSMEMNVLFRGKLPSKAALTRAMKELGFPFSISPPGGSLEKQTSFMPMRFRGDETGVEFDVFNDRGDIEDIAGEHIDKIDPGFDRSANFRWGGDEMEMLSAMCAAAALAKLVNGVVLDDAEGKLRTVEEAIALAREAFEAVAKPQDKRPGTRPADIKRYLKPLLKMRSDLALVGRRLVVRPVRHLLRGVLLDRTSDKYCFRVWRYIQPLYGFAGSVGVDTCIHNGKFQVWQPHFQPLLMDVMAEDIFAQVGQMTTLADLAEFVEPTGFREQRISTLILAGELERASEYVEQIQRDDAIEQYAEASVKAHWERASKNIEALCSDFHAKEAATVKALKLEPIWEPSPFPIEVPVSERTSRTAESAFSTTPWISRPEWLLADAPAQPGEVRFAKSAIFRNERVVLEVPLTSEQAEERHRGLETYTLAVRLPEGPLLLINRFGWDRNDPNALKYGSDYRPSLWFIVELYGPSRVLQVCAWQDEEDGSLIDLWSISAPKWDYHARLKDDERSIHDYRSDETVHSKIPLAAAERDLVRCPMPRFGEYAELVERIRLLLRYAGYGELT